MLRKWPSVNTAIILRIPKDSGSFFRTKRQPDELLCHDGLYGKSLVFGTSFSMLKGSCLLEQKRLLGYVSMKTVSCLCVSTQLDVCIRRILLVCTTDWPYCAVKVIFISPSKSKWIFLSQSIHQSDLIKYCVSFGLLLNIEFTRLKTA